MDTQNNPAGASQPNQASGGQTVNIFNIDQDLHGVLNELRTGRENLTKVFEQTRKAIYLLSDIASGSHASSIETNLHVDKYEEAGIDLATVVKAKLIEQSNMIDGSAMKYGVKSNLSEQFTHYDDKHTGAEAKNELLEAVETQMMSILYNKINEIRNKIEQVDKVDTPAPQQ